MDCTQKLNAQTFIEIKNCRIESSKGTCINSINWSFNKGESWLVTGPNGSGKAEFLNALYDSKSGFNFIKNDSNSIYKNSFLGQSELVSLERAAKIIQEERENDESDFMEEGIDKGRTGLNFIGNDSSLVNHPAVKLCGIEKILDRGLKYMSTGEIRRTLLARAVISEKQLLILSDPFAGLDAESRLILFNFINSKINDSENAPYIILGMERYVEIPDSITHVLEFQNKTVSFCGTKGEYENILAKRRETNSENEKKSSEEFAATVHETFTETKALQNEKTESNNSAQINDKTDDYLIEMNNVNVGWDDNKVLQNLSWKIRKGENWLIQGPNGSGKTTLLELITGDNMQVFCNDIKIFGKKRGSGETIWDIKKKLGIVSYRMHVEHRMLGGISLMNVIISGFHDSIGLYTAAGDLEIAAAKKWLAAGGFAGREKENFASLSYGEQRAVLILRAVVKKPELLILDEPCHGLDETSRKKILTLLEYIGTSGETTMLHVTHDPSEVLDCEKNRLVLKPGCTPMYEIYNL